MPIINSNTAASGPLENTISLLGGLYASQNSHLLTLSKIEKNRLLGHWRDLRRSIVAQLESHAGGADFHEVLASALLLSFVEVRYPSR